MKINKCVEQGIYVVLMLALEKEHRPVKSGVLSRILGVSDSYLKKVLRKMVTEGIITSNASKLGGFQLARSVEDITLYDIHYALEGKDSGLELSGLAHSIFVDDEKLGRDEQKVIDAFDNAFAAFGEELKKIRISDLLIRENYINGCTCWERKI